MNVLHRRFSLGVALISAAGLCLIRRQPEAALSHAHGAMVLSEENGFAQWRAMAQSFHGAALTELGQLDRGLAELQESITVIEARGSCRAVEISARAVEISARRGREAADVLAVLMTPVSRSRADHWGRHRQDRRAIRLAALDRSPPAQAVDSSSSSLVPPPSQRACAGGP